MRQVYSVLLDLNSPTSSMASNTETAVSSVQGKVSPEMKTPDSPRTVLEIPVLGTESDNSGSSSNGFSSSSSLSSSSSMEKLKGEDEAMVVPECHRLQWRKLIDVIKKKSLRRFYTFNLLMSSSEISKRSLNRKLARTNTNSNVKDFDAPFFAKPSWRSFNLEELASATDNFSSDNLIGKGGHAEVYRGRLSDGQLVAVKKLTKKPTEEERTGDFLSELGIIAHIDHPNAARLLGFGVEGGLHLVLEFSPHGSLASLLHGTDGSLDWGVRYRVAVGVAEGLNYLHRGCNRRIIHRDIKASNILLTKDYEPQISDFGLAKWLPDQWAHHIVYPIEGTFGYLAPEYFMHGIIDEKTDVFAFGVLLLELITGRHAIDSTQVSLVMWAKPLLDTNNVKELVDPRLENAYDLAEMKHMVSTASVCIHQLSTKRPDMNRVIQLLRGENGSLELMGREQKPHTGSVLLLGACDLDDYTCSTYLKDLNRHRQLALE